MIEDNCKLESGEKVVGLKQVVKGLQSNNIKTVYLAVDCDSFIEKKILPLVKGDVSIVKLYTQQQLGIASNIDVNAAVVGITKNNS